MDSERRERGHHAPRIAGAVIQHLGAALRERISFTDGRVDQSNYFDYQIMRMAQAPEVEVYFEPSRAVWMSGQHEHTLRRGVNRLARIFHQPASTPIGRGG